MLILTRKTGESPRNWRGRLTLIGRTSAAGWAHFFAHVFCLRIARRAVDVWERKGVVVEWHLLNFPRIPIHSDFLSGDHPGFGQQGKGFRSSLAGSRLDASGTVAHALFGEQHEQAAVPAFAISAHVVIPGDPISVYTPSNDNLCGNSIDNRCVDISIDARCLNRDN